MNPYRHPVPRRRPREGHRRGEIRRRVQRTRPRLWPRPLMAASLHPAIAKGRISAHRRERGVARRRRDRCAHAREPAAHGQTPISAYKDEVAPEGSPFRPLYDDRIMFSGQPIALVVAEEPEIARFAASLVRVEYDEEAHVTDVLPPA